MTLPLPNLLVDPAASFWLHIGVIFLATLASEDLTCIAVGLLVRAGRLDAAVGLLGCFVGIFLGDLGLWLIGRTAAVGVLSLPGTGRWLDGIRANQRGNRLIRWYDRRGGWAVLASRFLPGTRLPLYLTAGALGRSPGRFVLWTAVGCLLWVPLVVGGTALLGEKLVEPLSWLVGSGFSAVLLGACLLYLGLRSVMLAGTRSGRGKLLAAVSRLWRWEFWPAWLFYLPLLPWLAWLSLRHRGLLVWTAANPGIPQGGVVGESKYAILMQLPAESVASAILAPPGDTAERMEQIRTAVRTRGWTFPLILKPDAGQRGAGVKRVHDLADVEKYLREQPAAVVVQTYHPGPYEAGVFYYRLPGEETGRIFSITDKVFPILVGDGRSTLEELIWQHPRYRMQADVFLHRHEPQRDRILALGERLPLALAGNHCQGTLFRDGTHRITPELEQAVDAVARHFPGFFFGRFDIRYSDPESFAAGRDLAVIELNGATSESTNLYDPSWSLLSAYRTLFRQWELLYRIGRANQQRGCAAASAPDLLRLVWGYYSGRDVNLLAD